MNLFALTATSYRSIAKESDIRPGESLADTVPQSLLDSIATAQALRSSNASSLDAQADTALAALRAYRDNANPTNAQTVAIVKTLCRVAIALIRHRLGKLEATT